MEFYSRFWDQDLFLGDGPWTIVRMDGAQPSRFHWSHTLPPHTHLDQTFGIASCDTSASLDKGAYANWTSRSPASGVPSLHSLT